MQFEIARMHIARGLALLREQGFEAVADEPVLSFIQRGFPPRLGARLLRDAVERHLRGAMAGALLAEVDIHHGESVVCRNKLLQRAAR